MTRAEKAGIEMSKAIVEMVHLMYQDNTALHFYSGLVESLNNEYDNRVQKTIAKMSKANNASTPEA